VRLSCGMNGFELRHAEHALEEVLKHTASPDAQAPGLTRHPKNEGSCAPELGVRMHVELGATCPR
jgi:hypothetical protein